MIAREIIRLAKNRAPLQIVLQYTEDCNAACPQCGMRRSNKIPRATLGTGKARQIIDNAAKHGAAALSITGGEPLLHFDDVVELIQHASQAGIKYIRTGTNGFAFAGADEADFTARIEKVARALADTKIYTFWISVDSAVPGMHEKMRGLPGVIDGIRKALPIFHAHGIYPSANLGINRNIVAPGGTDVEDANRFYETFHEAFRNFYRYVIDMGFTIVNACYPMSVDTDEPELSAVYSATSTAKIVKFSRAEKALLFKALMAAIAEYRGQIRIFSPISSISLLAKSYNGGGGDIYPCLGGSDFFFVDAQRGETYPCGYRGSESLGDFAELDLNKARLAPSCYSCDWECFRDPSNFFGPVMTLLSNPVRFVRDSMKNKEHLKLWLTDLNYYRACDFFNGRMAPDYAKLKKYYRAQQ